MADPGADRASRLLARLADVTVNRPRDPPAGLGDPREKLPAVTDGEPPAGSRQRLAELGPAAFAAALRAQQAVAVTDTTLRDAHQSLLATRMRSFDMLAAAPALARELPGLFSLECWGGATFDVALRFLHESPWERLERPARGGPEHLPADAAARAQPARLPPLRGDGRARVRRGGRGDAGST